MTGVWTLISISWGGYWTNVLITTVADEDRIRFLNITVYGLLLWWGLFFIGFWVKAGRTLGMQSWGLRIETMNGEHPDFISATVRFFAALLSWLPFGLGYWWQLWDAHNLTWHDRISRTRLLHYPKGTRN